MLTVMLVLTVVSALSVTVIASGADQLVWQRMKMAEPVADLLIRAITYNGKKFVAVGREWIAPGRTNGAILTSPDGKTWSREELPEAAKAYILSGIAYGDGQLIAVGYQWHMRDLKSDGIVLTSPDGASWTIRQISMPYDLKGIAYANGLFVTVGRSSYIGSYTEGGRIMSNPVILVSQDGQSWEPQDVPEREAPFGISLNDIVYGNRQFVAVGYPDAVLTSTDGRGWEIQEPGTNDVSLAAITHGNGLFVAVTKVAMPVGGSAPILLSKDAVKWTMAQVPVQKGVNFDDVAYGAGRFVAVGSNSYPPANSSGPAIFTSEDGVRWSSGNLGGLDEPIYAVGYGNGLFVAAEAGLEAILIAEASEIITLFLQIGSKELIVEKGGERMAIVLDAVPEIPAGTSRTFLPIRPVVEALGGKILWFGDDRRVEIQSGDREIVLWIDNPIAHVNGVETPIDAANSVVRPYVAPPGRTMLPLRFIAEALGAKVLWDENLRQVTIIYPKSETATP